MRQNNALGHGVQRIEKKVAWPSGLRRWFKAPVSSGAWVRIPPLPNNSFCFQVFCTNDTNLDLDHS